MGTGVRRRAYEVEDRHTVLDLIESLAGFDVVTIDVDNTLIPDRASAGFLAAMTDTAHRVAAEAGVGRLVIVSNAARDRSIGAGIVWQVNKPFTRRSRLGIRPQDSVAVIGDRIGVDGLLAWRWRATLLLRPWDPRRSMPASRMLRRAADLIARRCFATRPLPDSEGRNPRRWLVRMERPANIGPAAPVPGVRIALWNPSRHDMIPEIYGRAFGADPWPADWNRFDGFDERGVFVAETESNEAVGFAICLRRDGTGYISVVAVVPRWRRRGVASALVTTAAGYLRQLGLERVRIDAYLDARAAVDTYRALGFEVLEVVADPDADPRGTAEE